MAGLREAFVTLCTKESYVKGALVVGHSLRMSGTTREIVCLTVEDLPPRSKVELLTVFDQLIDVTLTDTGDTKALQLLGRPDLGVTATKVACWTLTQYSKCVFLDADTLVLANVDDLFDRPELSAAPDVGWPDCFNSGVFVYVPSRETYGKLLTTLATEGSFDGGDQGLLNTFFSSWATDDAAHRLPFGYNMTTNAAYTYAPALARFKDSVKIVHFIGADKPWHGLTTGGMLDKWHAVYADLIQTGTRKPVRSPVVASSAYGTGYSPAPTPEHWSDNTTHSGDGGGGGGGGDDDNGFAAVRQMLDAAITEEPPEDTIQEGDEEDEEEEDEN
eukprot:m.165490 g.165490  ORF g.165490 m.165490 type:complete len:331 (+) comp12567_c0_seq1:53-1045(+)